jgi:hypothetical protein
MAAAEFPTAWYAAAMRVNIDYQERARRATLGLALMVSMPFAKGS